MAINEMTKSAVPAIPATTPYHDGYGARALLCPSCGFEYVHPTEVEVNAGGRITTITRGGMQHTKGPASGRGVRISIGLWCESGCGTRWTLQFHKGQTYSSVETEDVGSTTIWRD